MKRIFLLGSVLMAAMTSLAADVQTSENQVTIRPDGGQAKVIRLEVMNGNIIRAWVKNFYASEATLEINITNNTYTVSFVQGGVIFTGGFTVIIGGNDVTSQLTPAAN